MRRLVGSRFEPERSSDLPLMDSWLQLAGCTSKLFGGVSRLTSQTALWSE